MNLEPIAIQDSRGGLSHGGRPQIGRPDTRLYELKAAVYWQFPGNRTWLHASDATAIDPVPEAASADAAADHDETRVGPSSGGPRDPDGSPAEGWFRAQDKLKSR
jgi:hypothetical protein